MLIPSRRTLTENCPLYYPFGNTCVRNVLKDRQFAGDKIKVLFLGSGDLRNALKAAGNRKNLECLQIHLNDLDQSIIARNILILKIISADSFDAKNEEDLSFLWDLWYNAEWPVATRKRFELLLKELMDNNLPDNVSLPKSSYLRSLRNVWSAWSSISSKSKTESDFFMKKIEKERKYFIFNGWHQMHQTEVDLYESFATSFRKIVIEYSFHLATKFEGFNDSIKQNVQEEARQYFSTGTCRLKNEIEKVCVNPTMLDPATYHWQIHHQLCPFDGYLPLTRDELDISDDKKILIRTCQKILQNLVADYQKRIDGVKFVFHLEDALEFCLSETSLSFDVIDCSNLADHIGLIHLINACEKILSDTPGSTLFTEAMNWFSVAPTELEYVEESLGCPLSMIPTIYGLKLTNHVELGSSLPTNNLIRNTMRPILLCWKKALTFQNVKLSSSPELSRCLNHLAQRCFLPQRLEEAKFSSSKNTETSDSKLSRNLLQCEMSFTPLTFSYVVNSMIARVGGDPLCFRADAVEFPSVYNLNQRTLEAWKNNEILLKLSSDMQMNLLNQIKTKRSFQQAAAMRLVLAPLDKFKNKYIQNIKRSQLSEFSVFHYDFSDPEIHVIDNFELQVKQTAEGEIQTAKISFLLMPNHNLEKTHRAYVFDVTNSMLPIFFFEPVSSMRVGKYCQPYPFSSKGSQLPVVTKKSSMRVDSCIESVDKYTVKILIGCRKNVSGLKVSPNQCLPCESVHGLTLSLMQPNDIEPLALNFPFPILVNEISATLRRKNHLIDLVLKKALYEPWPFEFQIKQSRWIVDNLKLWKDGSDEMSSIRAHLGIQFKMDVLRSYELEHKQKTNLSTISALNEVRIIINSLFREATNNDQEFVYIRRKDSTQDPDWCLRVHLPVLMSPVGSPILLLSAIDHRLAENLALQGKLDMHESSDGCDDFIRIFESPKLKKNAAGRSLTIWTFSSEEEQLLRYVLRLNSTKIIPSTWQNNNLPLGEYSPWLATFVSPLYDDCPMNQASLDSWAKEKKKNNQTCCAACKKISEKLKRCSRCRVVFYCSVGCQHAHWTQHKQVCNKSRK